MGQHVAPRPVGRSPVAAVDRGAHARARRRGGFAALGQWQVERSFEDGMVSGAESEVAVPLDIGRADQRATRARLGGSAREVDATFVPGD